MCGGEGSLAPRGRSHDTCRQEVEPGHVSPTEPEVGAGHLKPTEPEVARPAPSWIPAHAILAWGLMSLMETTCLGQVGHMCGREGALAPWGGSRDTC